jgi:dTDP-4-dehydrorhamnose 3,5-epimerase
MEMNIIETEIQGVFIIEPKVFGDSRGYFFESFSKKEFDSKIGPVEFVQDNESKSCYGVVRGLHFQKPPHAQAKLVRVVKGKVLDVAVDLRKDSPTYGKHVAVELSEENHRQLFIPRGFAHGFAVLSDQAVFQYKCDDYYAPETEGAIAWDDPEIGIDWKIPEDKVILSPKDADHPELKDSTELFDYSIDYYI